MFYKPEAMIIIWGKICGCFHLDLFPPGENVRGEDTTNLIYAAQPPKIRGRDILIFAKRFEVGFCFAIF